MCSSPKSQYSQTVSRRRFTADGLSPSQMASFAAAANAAQARRERRARRPGEAAAGAQAGSKPVPSTARPCADNQGLIAKILQIWNVWMKKLHSA